MLKSMSTMACSPVLKRRRTARTWAFSGLCPPLLVVGTSQQSFCARPRAPPRLCAVRVSSRSFPRAGLESPDTKPAAPAKRDGDRPASSSGAAPVPQSESAPAWRLPVAGLVYAIFVVHNIGFGPGPLFDPGAIGQIIQGNASEVNDLFIAIFYALGQVGLIYFGLLMPAAGRQKRLNTLGFCTAGALLGLFGLGPYLAAREYAPTVSREEVQSQGRVAAFFESRGFGIGLVAIALGVYAQALGFGSPAEIRDVVFYACCQDTALLFATDRGVHATLIDGTLLSTVMMWGPLCEDMRRRGWTFDSAHLESYGYALSILAAPCLGPALYLASRPRLPSTGSGGEAQSQAE